MKPRYVAYDGDSVVGIATVREHPDSIGDCFVIRNIRVKEGFQGCGFGRQLLLEILRDADIEGVTLHLEIVPAGSFSYRQLKAWYTRHGFVQRGRPRGYRKAWDFYIRYPRGVCP